MLDQLIIHGQLVKSDVQAVKGQITVAANSTVPQLGFSDIRVKFLAAQGNTGDVLTSQGVQADPAWLALPSGSAAVQNVSSGNTSNIVISGNSTNVIIDTALTIGDIDVNNYQADVLANGTIVLANANSNFNNTATVNVSLTANGSGQVNIALAANGTALGIPAINATFATINTSLGTAFSELASVYAQANSQGTYANGTSVVANVANINFNNTTTVNVSITANGTQTNVALSANGTALGIPAVNTALGTMNANFGTINTTFGTTNTTFGTLNTSITTAASEVSVYANGTLTQAASNVNFNNTATVNVSTSTNGATQVNVAFSANGTALGIPAVNTALGTMNTATGVAYGQANAAYAQANLAANLVAVYTNGTLTMANANVNFNNTVSINVATAINAAQQYTNIAFSINTTMNLVSLNVSGNIANTGNLAVSQNTVTGNLTIVQNTTTGNLVISTLANTVTLNVSQNTVTGNLTVTMNTLTGNLSVTTLANIATGNIVTANIGTGNFTGTIASIGSPLSNTVTREVTGLAAIAQGVMSITSNITLSTDINLQITVNETGYYKIDGYMPFYGTTNAVGNVRMTLGGTATVNNMFFSIQGSSSLAGANSGVQSNTATAGNVSLASANANVQICNISSITQNQPDVVWLSGILKINASGTIFPMWAQATSAANAINRAANSYFMLTKIG